MSDRRPARRIGKDWNDALRTVQGGAEGHSQGPEDDRAPGRGRGHAPGRNEQHSHGSSQGVWRTVGRVRRAMPAVAG